MKMKPNWIEVEGSSNIAAIDFVGEIESGTMYIRFNNGGEYSYSDFPGELAADFLISHSKGKFFHANIRTQFKGVKIEEQEEQEPIMDDDMELAQEVLDREADGDDSDLIEVTMAEEEEVEQGESVF